MKNTPNISLNHLITPTMQATYLLQRNNSPQNQSQTSQL